MRYLGRSAVLTDPVLLTLVVRRHRIWLVALVHGVLLASVSGTVARALDDLPGLGPIAFWPAAAVMYAPTVGAVFDPFTEWRERAAARRAGPTAVLLLAAIAVPPAVMTFVEPDGSVAQLAACWAFVATGFGCVAAIARLHGTTWLLPASLLVASVFGDPPGLLHDQRWWRSPLLAVLAVGVTTSVAALLVTVDRRWGRYGHARG